MVEARSEFLQDRMALRDIYKQRKTTVVFTQQPIQPLATFTSGSQIQLVFQNSRNFLDLSKVQLLFRPVIQFQAEQGMTLEQRSLQGITPIDAQSFFTLQSVQINGNQITSQPQSNLQITRSIFQSVWNSLVNVKDNYGLTGDGDVFAGVLFSGGSGSALYGGIESSVLAPANGLIVSAGYVQGTDIKPFGIDSAPFNLTQLANSSLFEGLPYARAIISDFHSYYMQGNFNTLTVGGSGAVDLIKNDYYGQVISNFSDSIIPDAKVPASLDLLKFPLLAQAITPSASVYHKQQTRFQRIRMRFIQGTTTAFLQPSTPQGDYSRTLCIDQYQGISKTVNAEKTFVNVFTGDASNPPITAVTPTDETTTANNLTAVGAQCRMKYGQSVQNYTSGDPITRQKGVVWSSAQSNLRSQELYTQMSVSLGELSSELKDIGLLCMESCQVVVQLQVNIPQNCLSAYLPVGFIADPINAPALTCYSTFAQSCLIGNGTSVTVTDTTLRIEYTEFSDTAYPIMKQLMYQPKPYVSIRQQYDAIPGSGVFTQRLAIGSSSIIQGILVMFPAFNRNKPVLNASITRSGKSIFPQDVCVSYQGCQPPTDLRSTYKDSYYLECAQIYAECDGKRYQAMDLNLSNPQLSTYLVTQAGLQTCLGKYLNVDLQEYLMNRFCYFIPMNVAGDPSMRIQDQQIVITANIDGSTRVAHANTFNEVVKDINNQFGMLSFAITMQSLVDCSYVVV